ncbi:isocitrate lyase/phosphoenolpyruvate mutase family protein [Kribbella sancticallisti]|uniref:Isocitrate lyase/phosphoenolpyruvate mutase family protein n=1 Tax=Kribbella sancticallisti TaxID=460087 RepID=A0ABP4QNP1_9ACTN
MTTQTDAAEVFRALHRPGDPLLLMNIWDAGSARAVLETEPAALATSSWAVAAAMGMPDGETMPLDDVLALARSLVGMTRVPVSIDLESGYGSGPLEVYRCVRRAIATGAVGCNLEDRRPGSGSLISADDQAQRLRAARRAADETGVPLFLNARTDVFLSDSKAGHRGVEEVLARAHLYAAAGADGLLVPGLVAVDLIGQVVDGSPLPVNVMTGTDGDIPGLVKTGVARISLGAAPYIKVMVGLSRLAQQLSQANWSATSP